MVYDFKLKTGFFKTEECKLYIGHKKLKIIGVEGDSPLKIIIDGDDLISINISSKNGSLVDIEISTQNEIYRGIIKETSKSKEVICLLTEEFARKVVNTTKF